MHNLKHVIIFDRKLDRLEHRCSVLSVTVSGTKNSLNHGRKSFADEMYKKNLFAEESICTCMVPCRFCVRIGKNRLDVEDM